MDIDSAKAFKERLQGAVAEMSRALLIAQASNSADETKKIKRSIGHLIADVDVLLHESIYGDHPELNDLKERG